MWFLFLRRCCKGTGSTVDYVKRMPRSTTCRISMNNPPFSKNQPNLTNSRGKDIRFRPAWKDRRDVGCRDFLFPQDTQKTAPPPPTHQRGVLPLREDSGPPPPQLWHGNCANCRSYLSSRTRQPKVVRMTPPNRFFRYRPKPKRPPIIYHGNLEKIPRRIGFIGPLERFKPWSYP